MSAALTLLPLLPLSGLQRGEVDGWLLLCGVDGWPLLLPEPISAACLPGPEWCWAPNTFITSPCPHAHMAEEEEGSEAATPQPLLLQVMPPQQCEDVGGGGVCEAARPLLPPPPSATAATLLAPACLCRSTEVLTPLPLLPLRAALSAAGSPTYTSRVQGAAHIGFKKKQVAHT